MTLQPIVRLVAGAIVLVSVAAGMFVDPRFLWITLFVGANLVQSGFTNWCPLMTMLRRAHVREQ